MPRVVGGLHHDRPFSCKHRVPTRGRGRSARSAGPVALCACFQPVHASCGTARYLARFVFAPAIGAVIGLLGAIGQATLLQYLVVLVAVALAMIAMRLLRVANGSVLVIVLLPIVHGSLVGPDAASRHNPLPIYTYWYPVWILVYATVLFLVFKAWRHTLPLEERVEHRVEEAEERLEHKESSENIP